MSYWNPNNPNTATINYGVGTPVDALTRIAAALERIAFQLEQYNVKHSVTVTTTTAPKPRAKVRKRVR